MDDDYSNDRTNYFTPCACMWGNNMHMRENSAMFNKNVNLIITLVCKFTFAMNIHVGETRNLKLIDDRSLQPFLWYVNACNNFFRYKILLNKNTIAELLSLTLS